MNDPFKTFQSLDKIENAHFYSLPELEESGVGPISRLPVSIRIVLESMLRNFDGKRIQEEDIKSLANWNAKEPSDREVPFVVSRVVLQDFTGVPLLVDLAAMREAVAKRGEDPSIVEPLVPVDLVVDHSVQVDRSGTDDSFLFNLKVEFERNKERYSFLKWGQQAFDTLQTVPPGIGIVHQVNLELLASVVMSKEKEGKRVLFPDTLVGTDSHTTMINGLGVVGWGVGGIEAEAAILGQPVFIQTPEVIGVHMTGKLNDGVTATDLTLRVTELLRAENVVGKFVEFHGEGVSSMSLADRATIGNMAPEYGATMGFFPTDEQSLEYLKMTGRDPKHIEEIRSYLKAQGLFGIPRGGEIDYTKVLELDLSSVKPSVSGPKRPQDRINVPELKSRFMQLLSSSTDQGGYGQAIKTMPKICVHSEGAYSLQAEHETGGKPFLDHPNGEPDWSEAEMVTNRPFTDAVSNPGYSEGATCDRVLSHGSVVIAAITSCTNTSNPAVMIAAGLVAKKAVERGLKVHHLIKTSLAPGSRVVTDYLERTGLQRYLDELGFNLVAYGCTTCIGNSGPLDQNVEEAIRNYDLVTASVLSGNRNFEARIHGNVKANFLMSPPLVVAYALAGKVDIDLEKEPISFDKDGKKVFLKDLWPSNEEVQEEIKKGIQPDMFRKRYANVHEDSPVWKEIEGATGELYSWQPDSTYIRLPPYFENFETTLPSRPTLEGMRPLAIFGDSVTTDHISPAGAFSSKTPAGEYLLEHGIPENKFNSYGSRRGNHEVMMRGTFANVRIRNLLADGREGGFTKVFPGGELTTIYDASLQYRKENVPLIVLAGKDYGMGSSRDWAAKGSQLLGVHAVVAESFERIHRSNLIGMGVLPLTFEDGHHPSTLGLTGEEMFTIKGLEKEILPGQTAMLEIREPTGKVQSIPLKVRLDTPIEVDYYLNGGIMPYVLRQLIHN